MEGKPWGSEPGHTQVPATGVMALHMCFQNPGPYPVRRTGRCLASRHLGGPDLHVAVGWALDGRGRWKHDWSRCTGPAQLHLLGSNISERARQPSGCQQLCLCPQAFSEAVNARSTHVRWPETLGGQHPWAHPMGQLGGGGGCSLRTPRVLRGVVAPVAPRGNLFRNASCPLSWCFGAHLPNQLLA